MNKTECKKYVRKAFNKMKANNMELTPKNMEKCMREVINNETRLYVAYGKMAMHILNNSATTISAKQLVSEIDVIPKLYDEVNLINNTEGM